MSRHTLSVLVENQPGVLARIAGLFSRRGFNIDSLAVGPTEHADVSRMTIVVNVEELPLEQVTKQLNKLVEVIKVVELSRGRIVDLGPESVIVEMSGPEADVDAFVGLVRMFGIKELVRTGAVVMARGSASIEEALKK